MSPHESYSIAGVPATYLLDGGAVADDDEWKSVFDANRGVRERYGIRSRQLFRSTDDPNAVVILFEFDDRTDADARVESFETGEMREKAAESGLTEFEVTYLERVEEQSAATLS